MTSNKGQVVTGIAIKLLNVALAFGVTLMLARLLGSEEYGVYSVVLALIMVVAIPSSVGLPAYVVREVAKAEATTQPARSRDIVATAAGTALVISISLACCLLGWAIWAAQDGSYRTTLLIGSFMVPVVTLVQVFASALRGLNRTGRGLLLELVLRTGIFLTMIIAYLASGGELSAPRSMALHLGGGVLALCFGCYSWLVLRPKVRNSEPRSVDFKQMIASTGVLGLVAGSLTLNSNLDILLLGALSDAATAGVYKLASTAALLSVAGLQAINMVMMPQFARLYESGDRNGLQELATRSVRYILATMVPASIVMLLFGRWLIAIAFGPEYAGSYWPMVILIGGQAVSAMLGSVISLLNMTGHEMDTLKGVLLGTFTNVVLNLALIPSMGASGAAIATACTLACWNVYLHLKVRKLLFVNSSAFAFLDIPADPAKVPT